VQDQGGKAEPPLDRALGGVDMLDATERHDRSHPNEQTVTNVELILPS
jgi:hypothetical protein